MSARRADASGRDDVALLPGGEYAQLIDAGCVVAPESGIGEDAFAVGASEALDLLGDVFQGVAVVGTPRQGLGMDRDGAS